MASPGPTPAGDVCLVVNPTAGKGNGARVRQAVVDRLQKGGVGVHEVIGRDADHALSLVREQVTRGIGALVALGGDGMVNLALQAVAGTDTPLGIIPAGTGNDLAHCLGLPIGDPLAAADVVIRGVSTPIDAVQVGERWFSCVLGAGFDSIVNERANRMSWPRGPQRYNVAILAELPFFTALPFVITLDGEEWQTEAMLVAVGNAKSYGAGILITPDAELDDGLLDVCVIGPVSKLDFIRTFPSARKGTHVTHPKVEIRRARTVTLAAPGVVAYADGERFGPLPLTCVCVPGAVGILTP